MSVMMEEVLYQLLLISLDFYRARSHWYKLNQQEEKEVLYDRDKKLNGMAKVIMVNSFFRVCTVKFYCCNPGL
jgi:hypothetical protein